MAGWLAEKEALFGRLPENVVYDLYQNVGVAKVENCHMFEVKAVKKDDRMLVWSIYSSGLPVLVQGVLGLTASGPKTFRILGYGVL